MKRIDSPFDSDLRMIVRRCLVVASAGAFDGDLVRKTYFGVVLPAQFAWKFAVEHSGHEPQLACIPD